MLATDERPLGGTSALGEARRMLEICNACRYCEGVCPVFPAMELHRSFSDGDLGHLARRLGRAQPDPAAAHRRS